jgi:hypothetical protein
MLGFHLHKEYKDKRLGDGIGIPIGTNPRDV